MGSSSPSSVELELYQLAVEMADRVSARRTTANNFFLALHAAMVAAVGLVERASAQPVPDPKVQDPLPVVLASLAGIVLAVAWWLALRSYRDLNEAKFAVILDLERRLPVQIFGDEWTSLKKDELKSWRDRYAEQGTVERVVPFVFGVIYVVALAVALLR